MLINKNIILESLLHFNKKLNEIDDDLSQLSWDSNEELVVLTKNMIINILNRFLNHEISSFEIEKWAELIEGREDIGIEIEFKEYINNIIFSLANPILSFPDGIINDEVVNHLLNS